MPRVPDRPDARLRLEGRRIVHGNTSHEIRVKSSFTYGFKLRQCYLWGNIIKHYFHSHPDTNILRFAAYYIGHHLYPFLSFYNCNYIRRLPLISWGRTHMMNSKCPNLCFTACFYQFQILRHTNWAKCTWIKENLATFLTPW